MHMKPESDMFPIDTELERTLRSLSVTPHSDEVHSTCNCKGANVH